MCTFYSIIDFLHMNFSYFAKFVRLYTFWLDLTRVVDDASIVNGIKCNVICLTLFYEKTLFYLLFCYCECYNSLSSLVYPEANNATYFVLYVHLTIKFANLQDIFSVHQQGF